MQLNPARGRKLTERRRNITYTYRFMQLNPARGRKRLARRARSPSDAPRFMQLNPARGRKHQRVVGTSLPYFPFGLCSSTPRGDGNLFCKSIKSHARVAYGLCSSTPRGDGNSKPDYRHSHKDRCKRVYAAQPREGTETVKISPTTCETPRFMQLNPARGRKHQIIMPQKWEVEGQGLCSSTPRGDGNEPHTPRPKT